MLLLSSNVYYFWCSSSTRASSTPNYVFHLLPVLFLSVFDCHGLNIICVVLTGSCVYGYNSIKPELLILVIKPLTKAIISACLSDVNFLVLYCECRYLLLNNRFSLAWMTSGSVIIFPRIYSSSKSNVKFSRVGIILLLCTCRNNQFI